MPKEQKEVAKNQQGEKRNDGSPGNPTLDTGELAKMEGAKGKGLAGKDVKQHKHRVPKNNLFGPYQV